MKSVPPLSRNVSVEAAAAASGYSSAQSLARAMRAQTGASPGVARTDSELLVAALRRARPVGGRNYPIPAMTVDIVSVRPIKLLAIRNVGAYEELNAAYGKLFELVTQQVPVEAIAGLYGISFDEPRWTPKHECRASCAVDVGMRGAPVGELEALTLGGRQYARLRHNGSYDDLEDSVDTLFAFALASLAVDIADVPHHVHYLDDPDQVAEADLRCDRYLPLASRVSK